MIDLTEYDPYNAIYPHAVDATSRYVSFQVEINVLPQEIEYIDESPFPSSPSVDEAQSPLSKRSQLHDADSKVTVHGITMELNRWIIGDMSFAAYDSIDEDSEIGYESLNLTNTTGYSNKGTGFKFQKAGYVAGVGIDFSQNVIDGFPINFSISVQRGNSYSNKNITNNTKRSLFVALSNGGLNNPTSVRINVSKWSLPNRRARITEIWVGYHDIWTEDKFSSVSISQKGSIVPFSIPYTTCTLQLDNSDKLFDPTNKYGLFRAITDRQPVIVSMNALNLKELYDPEGLPDSFLTYFTVGTFYQYDNGWKTGNSELTMTWNLVDLMGLLADRAFDVTALKEVTRYPFTYPIIALTTVEDWVKAVLSQLGKRYASMYEIPREYASIELPKMKKDMLVDITCGDLLLWICQYINCWMRLTPDGKIYIGKFDRYRQDTPDRLYDLTFRNMSKYPTLKANDSIARIDFSIPRVDSQGMPIADTEETYPVYGEDQASSNTESVSNPFIRTEAKALEFANYVLQWYGGNQIETSNRGNPIYELGDLVCIEMSKGSYSLGRIIEQTFELNDHVMKDCKTTVVCVDNLGDYNSYVIITAKDVTPDGLAYWTVPDNLELDEYGDGRLKIVLVQAGQSGGHGLPTIWSKDDELEQGGEWLPGDAGISGSGGKIFIVDDLDQVHRGEVFSFNIGLAAEPRSTVQYRHDLGGRYMDMSNEPEDGGETVAYWEGGTVGSSNDGYVYPDGYIEPVSGKHLGRTRRGVPSPDSGDGGSGGGSAYAYLEDTNYTPEDLGDREALAGSVGIKGADGCAIICYKSGPDNTGEIR